MSATELASSTAIFKILARDFQTVLPMLREDKAIVKWQEEIDEYRQARASGEQPTQAELDARSNQIARSFALLFPRNIFATSWPMGEQEHETNPVYHIQFANEDVVSHRILIVEEQPDMMKILYDRYEIQGKLPEALALFHYVFTLPEIDRDLLMTQAVRGDHRPNTPVDILRLRMRENGLFEAIRVRPLTGGGEEYDLLSDCILTIFILLFLQ